VPFALLSLMWLGEALNVYSMLGLFMLFGIVKKNGILQIDYTNTLRARGVPRDEAIRQANRVRLRPILMTTVMLIFGMMPIALGQGPGSGSRGSIARVIVGGQALSLLITLLITPVAYSPGPSVSAIGSTPRLRIARSHMSSGADSKTRPASGGADSHAEAASSRSSCPADHPAYPRSSRQRRWASSSGLTSRRRRSTSTEAVK